MYTPLTEFSYFSILPAELRIKIWLLSFHQRRLIEIRTGDYPANIEYITNAKGNKTSDIRWVTKCPPPSALSVCREARHLALKFWTLRFALLAGGDEVIYINLALDTIYVNFKYIQFLPILLKDIQSFNDTNCGVRSLALAKEFFGSYNMRILGHKGAMLRGLDMLTLVIKEEEEYPYACLDKWEEGCILVVPETEEELKQWEETARSARRLLFESAQGRLIKADLCVAAIRRGKDASCLGNEDQNNNLEGPLRL